MKAVILAAGIGSRLHPLTITIPKCMVKIYGKPLLEYQLDAYRTAGIREIYIVVGHEAQVIKDYCNQIVDLTIHLIDNFDYKITNNMYSLYLLKKHLENESFILNNADLIIDKAIVSLMVNDVRPNLIAVDTSQYNDESMKIKINEHGDIIDISKVIPKEDAWGCSIDYYKFSASVSKLLFDKISDIIENKNKTNQWMEFAFQELLKTGELKMRPFDINNRRWVEIDNYEDLYMADRLFANIKPDLTNIDVLFLDLDGTVFLGDEVIAGCKEFLLKMRAQKKKLYFLSNNSSKDKKQYIDKLFNFGISAAEGEIILSTDGLLNYLGKEKIKSVYVVGTQALIRQIERVGIEISEIAPEYVIVGYDTELSYEKLAKATLLINKGVGILATHCDTVCPTPSGFIPDAGSILKLLEVATGKMPSRFFGKPHASMIQHILDIRGGGLERVAIIGDRLYTDMKLADNTGIKSILVLSGETTRDDVQSTKVCFDLVIPSLKSLI